MRKSNESQRVCIQRKGTPPSNTLLAAFRSALSTLKIVSPFATRSRSKRPLAPRRPSRLADYRQRPPSATAVSDRRQRLPSATPVSYCEFVKRASKRTRGYETSTSRLGPHASRPLAGPLAGPLASVGICGHLELSCALLCSRRSSPSLTFLSVRNGIIYRRGRHRVLPTLDPRRASSPPRLPHPHPQDCQNGSLA